MQQQKLRLRRKKLLKSAQKIGCDTLVTFEPENLFYMTGFWGEAIGMLEKDGETTIIVPKLEADRAKAESQECVIITSERGSRLISLLVSKIKNKKTCIVVDSQNYDTITSLKKSVPHIKATTMPFYTARMTKDQNEIAILKKASKIIDNMFELCIKKIKAGQKESELQTILMSYAMEQQMFDTGYRSTLNPLIIASGPNGALPHAQVTNRKFKKGELIVIDLTLRYKGYVSDSTRTFGIGTIPLQTKEIYEIVQESQKLGLKAVKPGVSSKTVDLACRQYINEQGYGKYFIHSTGHGIGIDVHESPIISYNGTTKLLQNMAITVEPGIYMPEKLGVRIEDSLIVQKKKPIVMHKFTKDLVIV